MGDVTGEEVTHELSFVDPLDLLRQGNRMAPVGIDAGDTEQDGGNASPLGADERLSFNLGFRIGPLRLERPVFVDALPRFAGSVDEHRAGEDKLLDVKCLQRPQQPLRALHGDVVIFPPRLPREIIVGSQVQDRGEGVPIAFAHIREPALHTFV